MKKTNVFYVYEWYNRETLEVFYVGKGKNGRYKDTKKRNKYFLNYYNKYKCDVKKVKENMEESEAFDLEIELIKKYREKGQCKCNISDGGEGCSYGENTWHHLFRSLQYSHDVRHGTSGLHNEEDYDSCNLKNKTVEELQEMYDEYNDFKECKNSNYHIFRSTGLKTKEELDEFELIMKNKEIKIMTDVIATSISSENEVFKTYSDIKNDYDFYTTDIAWDDFINEIVGCGGYDYGLELLDTCRYNFMYLKHITKQGSVPYKLISYNLKEDGTWHLRCQHIDNYKHFRVKVDMRDIVMGILMAKHDMRLYENIHAEILSAPIY